MTAASHRITSLDVFRGLAVAAMIVVNNPGNWNAVYAPLSHAYWNGWTFADTVFPSFVFIVGVSLPFVIARRRAGARAVLPAVARRSALLVALGVALNALDALGGPTALRLPGVLQRIGLAYAVAAPVVALAGVPGWAVTALGLLLVHTALLLGVPFGGHPAGTLTAAANLPGYVDAAVFGRHMLTATHDPEGLVGTLSTAATMLCGALAGAWLQSTSDTRRRASGLAAGGMLALAAGLAWSAWLPLNKTLWTGSFALASAGLAAIAFALCYEIVDVQGWRAWAAPLVWLGVNPLAVYCLSEIARHALDVGWMGRGGRLGVKDAIFWRHLAGAVGDAGGTRSSLLFALAFTAVWIGVAGLLYRKDVRLRV